MKILLIIFLSIPTLLLQSLKLSAQNIQRITARVTDSNHEPLMGNALLYVDADPTFKKGISFLNGSFELLDIRQKEVMLKLTSLLFADTLILVKYNGVAAIDLGTIVIKTRNLQLNEVRVSAQQPLTRYLANGNLEVKVANTILANSSSLIEILSRAPNVIINDGQIAVAGKGEATIYLNGRLITAERMASIPASQIEKIEVISNPSSKYDAEGKAVINIITKTNAGAGLLGSLSQQVSVSKFAGLNTNSMFDFNYNKEKLSVVGNYALFQGKDRERLYTTRVRPSELDFLKSELTTNWNRKLHNRSNYGLGAQYAINNQKSLSLAYSGNLEKQGGSQDSKNSISTQEGTRFYSSETKKKEHRLNHSLTFNYNQALDTMGSVFFVGSQYSSFHADINDLIDEQSLIDGKDGFRLLKNSVQHQILISSSQADYSRVFNADEKLELGLKFSYVNTHSGTGFQIADNGDDFKPDRNLSNDFEYREKIPATYINYNGLFMGKIKFGLGFRAEWTNYLLNTSVGGGQMISDNYFNIFPNLMLSRLISERFKLSASYVSRIGRPRYQALNPFVIYQDPFTTIEGNPNLLPEKVHAFELGANYRKIDLRLGYNYVNDPLSAAALRGNTPNSYVLKGLNLEKSHAYFAALSVTTGLGFWTAINTVNLNYTKMIDDQFAFTSLSPKPQWYLYSSNTFNVKNLFKVQLLAWYLGEGSSGLYQNRSRSSVTIGLDKEFFKDALKLKFLANDIFNQTNNSGNYSVGQTDIFFDRTFNNNYFRLMVTYNFGKLKQSTYKNKSTGQAENSRAN
ncbi:TonB-dependent receptor domain-containing protein [Pedobacter gandavensis]|uniref:TonB-dependent receptor domain-containing protein n=1 Tax=Pedobacter gandavensis TaxID=2679963 RepID=UPI00292EC37C|nr:TonB-dependent receptor [Pedobacter gandavensis]